MIGWLLFWVAEAIVAFGLGVALSNFQASRRRKRQKSLWNGKPIDLGGTLYVSLHTSSPGGMSAPEGWTEETGTPYARQQITWSCASGSVNWEGDTGDPEHDAAGDSVFEARENDPVWAEHVEEQNRGWHE